MARPTAAAWPAITTCSGEFRFAALTISPCAASARIESSLPAGSLRMGGMAPTPAGAASCLLRPAVGAHPDRIGKAQPSRRHQRRIFAQAVARHEIRRQAVLAQYRMRGGGNGEQGRLRVLGELELLFGSFEAEA